MVKEKDLPLAATLDCPFCCLGGRPLVVSDPASHTAAAFMDLGAAVVREIAKLEAAPRSAVR